MRDYSVTNLDRQRLFVLPLRTGEGTGEMPRDVHHEPQRAAVMARMRWLSRPQF